MCSKVEHKDKLLVPKLDNLSKHASKSWKAKVIRFNV